MKVKRKSNPAFDKAIKQLDKAKTARVGWFESSQYEDGTPVAYVAAIQEYGSPKNSIPPRPFFRNAIEANQQEWKGIANEYGKRIVNGQATIDQAMEAIGLVAAGDVRKSISEIMEPPLSPVTLLLRKWKSEGQKISGKSVGWAAHLVKLGLDDSGGVSTKPLIDSGYMQATVTSIVE